MSAPDASKVNRRAARALVGEYHEARLAELHEHVRAALGGFDAGELDAFDVDAVIHQYTRAARELWKTCAMPAGNIEAAAWMLEDMAARGEAIDWWEAGAPRRRDR